MSGFVAALWNIDLGEMRPRRVGPIVRATVRLFVALAFVNIVFGAVILTLLLARR